MLDDHHGDVHLLRQQPDQVVDLVDLGIDEAGRRLVHEQQLRTPHQQAGEQQLAAVERFELDGGHVRRDLEMHQFGAVFGVEAGQVGQEGLPRRLEGFADRQFVRHDRGLERAADPQPGAGMQRQSRDVPALVGHTPALGLDAAGEHLEQAGLAGAVGADDAQHLAAIHLEADAVQDLAPAEVEVNIFAGEEPLRCVVLLRYQEKNPMWWTDAGGAARHCTGGQVAGDPTTGCWLKSTRALFADPTP